eukprot:1158902-Pelagomonas_calceolata.AAC.4
MRHNITSGVAFAGLILSFGYLKELPYHMITRNGQAVLNMPNLTQPYPNTRTPLHSEPGSNVSGRIPPTFGIGCGVQVSETR